MCGRDDQIEPRVGAVGQPDGMSVSESEFFATGMSLPPDVRKRAALRLLESVDPDEAFAVAAEE